jgi:hypothetical protein
MYSTIEEAWGIETFTNTNNNNTNTNNTNNNNTNTKIETFINDDNKKNETFINNNNETFINDDNKQNEIIYIKQKPPKKLKNKNIIQAFLIGILIILILQLINNKFIKNI